MKRRNIEVTYVYEENGREVYKNTLTLKRILKGEDLTAGMCFKKKRPRLNRGVNNVARKTSSSGN